MKNNNHIVKINGQLHIYKDGIYIPGAVPLEAAMIIDQSDTFTGFFLGEILTLKGQDVSI